MAHYFSKTIKCVFFFIIFSDVKAVFPLVYLFVSKSCNRTEWGVIKVGTNDRYQNWHQTVI